MYVLVIFCYNFDTSTGYDTDNDGRLERLVCRVARYKQESAKYRKIVAVVLILLAVLAAVWLAERWYTRHKTSAAAAGVNPIGQLLTGQPDPAEPYTGTISLVVAGYDRSAEDGEEEIGLTDMILYLQWDCDRNKLEVLQVPPSLYVGWSTGQAEAGEGKENAADPTGQGSGFECYAIPPGQQYHDESVALARLTAQKITQTGQPLRGQDGVRYIYFDTYDNRMVYESSDETPHNEPTFRLLADADCPAVLVEQCFLTNPQDAARLATPSGAKQAAKAYYEAICEWMEGR